MTTFDQREQDFETRFAHDEEVRFKIDAYRNKSFGLWAAYKMGLSDANAANYSEEIVKVGVDAKGVDKVIERVAADFWGAGMPVRTDELTMELRRLESEARQALGIKA